jgi:hypothetical protein
MYTRHVHLYPSKLEIITHPATYIYEIYVEWTVLSKFDTISETSHRIIQYISQREQARERDS